MWQTFAGSFAVLYFSFFKDVGAYWRSREAGGELGNDEIGINLTLDIMFVLLYWRFVGNLWWQNQEPWTVKRIIRLVVQVGLKILLLLCPVLAHLFVTPGYGYTALRG